MLELSAHVRAWLTNPSAAEWTTTDFSAWQSSTPTQNGFFAPQFSQRDGPFLAREPLIVSPQLDVALPTRGHFKIELTLKALPPERIPAEGILQERASLEENLPGTLLLPYDYWSVAMQRRYQEFFDSFLAAQTSSSPVFLSKEALENSPARFVVSPSCNSDHGKKESAALVFDQRLLSDELHFQKVELFAPGNQGTVTLSGELACAGAQLTKLVLLGPPTAVFALNRLTISFPALK